MFFIFIIMCMRVIQSIFNKRTALIMPNGIRPYILYIAVSDLFAAFFSLITLVLSGSFSGFNLQAFLIAACSGSFLALGSYSGIKALMSGTMVLSSIFSTAGIIIPCILGIFFFGESLSVIQCVCMTAVILSAVMLIDSNKKLKGTFSFKALIYLLLSFLTNGMVMFCQKLFGYLQPEGNVSLFSLLTFLIPSAVLFIVLLFMPRSEKSAEKLPKKMYLYITYLSFAVFVIQQLVTLITPVMSSALLFTLVNGSATVIAAIVGAIMYKEKITVKSFFGLVIGITALIIIKLV